MCTTTLRTAAILNEEEEWEQTKKCLRPSPYQVDNPRSGVQYIWPYFELQFKRKSACCLFKSLYVIELYVVKSWTKCSSRRSRRVVTSTCHLVASTCHLVGSTCHFVVSTRRPVVSSSHLVVSTFHLLASASGLVVSSFQLVVSPHKKIENTLRQKRQTMHKLKYPHGEFSFKIDELNAVKDLLRDPVSRMDQNPPQNIHRPRILESRTRTAPSTSNTSFIQVDWLIDWLIDLRKRYVLKISTPTDPLISPWFHSTLRTPPSYVNG